MKILLKNNLHIKIDTDDRQYIEDLKDYFSFPVPGHAFMPRFKNTGWDGKVCLVIQHNVLPYGLFVDFVKWHKKKYSSISLELDDKVKALFIGRKLKPKYNLLYKPRDYQQDCIETILHHSKCIVKVATASGKSLIISYVIKTLMERFKDKQYLIIVPTTNLVEQFFVDMIEYGIDKEIVGRVYADIKEPDKPIVISTWQSLMNNHDWLYRFYGICVDECHISSNSIEVKKILQKILNAVYRFGVTGTLPSQKLELSNIKAYLGPVVKDYSTKELADEGWISKVCITTYNIEYPSTYDGEYMEIREKVFSNPARMRFIKDTIKDIDGNVLILLSLVEKEGMVLEEYLNKHLPDRETMFIYGDTKVKEREYHRHDFDGKNNKIVIATWGIYKMGVNIPSLKYIMFASPLKSKISILQSVGRVLRTHVNKTDGAHVIDLIDQVPYLHEHGEIRMKYYLKEGFEINEKRVCLLPPPDMI